MRLLVLWLAVAASAHAQLPESVGWSDVARLVRERSPALAAVRHELAVADAEVGEAGVLPNPELGYMGYARFDGSANAINGSQHQLWLEQRLPIWGTIGARQRAARQRREAVEAEIEVAERALVAEALRGYASLAAAAAEAALLEEVLAQARAAAAIVEGRAAAGAASQYDVVRARVEVGRIEALAAAARARIDASSAELAALFGAPAWRPRPREGLEVALGPSREALPPAVRAAERRLAAAESAIDEAERARLPVPTIQLGAYLTSDGDSVSGVASLVLPLPVFDTGDASVRRARAERDAASSRRDATRARYAATLAARRRLLSARARALEALEAGPLREGARLPELARAAYETGRGGVLEVVDALAARLELESSRLELLELLRLAEIDVLELAGRRDAAAP